MPGPKPKARRGAWDTRAQSQNKRIQQRSQKDSLIVCNEKSVCSHSCLSIHALILRQHDLQDAASCSIWHCNQQLHQRNVLTLLRSAELTTTSQALEAPGSCRILSVDSLASIACEIKTVGQLPQDCLARSCKPRLSSNAGNTVKTACICMSLSLRCG